LYSHVLCVSILKKHHFTTASNEDVTNMHQLSTTYSVCTPAGETMLRPWQDTPQLFTYCCIPCQTSLAIVHQPKALSATKDYLVTYTANISVNSWKGMLGSMVVGESVQE
jgi:hypothetical protein